MKRILYIRLNDKKVESDDDIIAIDCRQISEFYSFIGYALIKGLYQEGVPYYRLLAHPGTIFLEFSDNDKEGYLYVLEQWYKIIDILLRNTNIDDDFNIRMPVSFTNWLYSHTNKLYSQIGETLSSNNFTIQLNSTELREEILTNIKKVIEDTYLKYKNEISHIVLDDAYINSIGISLDNNVTYKNSEQFEAFYLFFVRPFKNDYQEVKSFSEGFAPIKRNGKWGFVDVFEDEVIKCEYDEVKGFSEDRAVVKDGNFLGVINRDNYKIIQCIYHSGWSAYKDGRLALQYSEDSCIHFYDRDGRQLDTELYDYVWGNSNGIAIASIKHPYGEYQYIDINGNILFTKSINDFVEGYSENLALYRTIVGDNGYLTGFINKNGDFAIYPKYKKTKYYFKEGLCGVVISDKWGFIDKTGNLVIPNQYTDVGNFSEGLCAVEIDGKWGFMDTTGCLIIPCEYDTLPSGINGYWDVDNRYFFSEGFAAVRKSGKWGYINKKGQIIIPFIYDDAGPYKCHRAFVKRGHKYGFIRSIRPQADFIF